MADDDLLIRARLRDELSGPLRQVERRIENTARATRRLSKVANGELHQGLSRVGRGVSSLSGHLSKADGWLRNASRSAGQLATRVGVTLAGGLAAGAAAATFFGLKAAQNLELSRVALEGLTGSAAGAEEAFAFLKEVDPKAPFDIGQLALVYQQLANSGIAGAELKATLQGVIDVAAFTPDRLGDISYAVMQIRGSSKLLTQDLRQLNSAGVNVSGALDQAFGITFGQFLEQAEKGADFASAPFLEALFGLTTGRAEKVATETLTGLLSGVRSRIMLELSDAANPLMQSLKANLPSIEAGITSVIRVLAPPLIEVGGVLLDLVVRALPLLAPVLGALASGVSMLATAAGPAFLGMAPVMDELALAIGELVTELVPVMPALVDAFVALVGVFPVFVGLLADLVPLLSPLAGLVSTLLGFDAVRVVAAGLLGVLLGYRVLAGIVGTLYQFAAGIGAINAQAAAGGAVGPGGAAGGARGPGRLIGGALGLVGGGVGMFSGIQSGQQNGVTAGGILSGAGGGAMVGATLGSIVPGVGTGIGALAGGVVGGGAALLSGMFGGAKKEAPRPQTTPTGPDAATMAAIAAAQQEAAGLQVNIPPGGIQVYPSSTVDLELGLARGIETYDRNRRERG